MDWGKIVAEVIERLAKRGMYLKAGPKEAEAIAQEAVDIAERYRNAEGLVDHGKAAEGSNDRGCLLSGDSSL